MSKYEEAIEAIRNTREWQSYKSDSQLTEDALVALLYYIRELETRLYILENKPEPYDYFRPIG